MLLTIRHFKKMGKLPKLLFSDRNLSSTTFYWQEQMFPNYIRYCNDSNFEEKFSTKLVMLLTGFEAPSQNVWRESSPYNSYLEIPSDST